MDAFVGRGRTASATRLDDVLDGRTRGEPFSAVWVVHANAGGVGRTTVAKCLARAVQDLGFRPLLLDCGNDGDGEVGEWCARMLIDHAGEADMSEQLKQRERNRIVIADVGSGLTRDQLRELVGSASVVLSPVPDAWDSRAVSAALQSAHRVRETIDWTYGSCTARHYTLQMGTGQYVGEDMGECLPLPLDDDEYPYIDPVVDVVTEGEVDYAEFDRQSAFLLRERLRDVPTTLLTTTIAQGVLAARGQSQSYRDDAKGRLGQKSYQRLARELLRHSDGRLVPDGL
jgi:hypothetical protein